MMTVRRICGLIVGVCLVVGFASSAAEAVTVYIDMDTALDGIQDTRDALPGDKFFADVVFDVGAGGVSSYGVSVSYDVAELNVQSAPTELLPAGFQFNLSAGVGSWGNGMIETFEAAGFGMGPANQMFVVGTIPFEVKSVLDDGRPDVTPGLFTTGVDGVFDNAGAEADLTFMPGYVVPEPASLALLLLGGVAVLRRR